MVHSLNHKRAPERQRDIGYMCNTGHFPRKHVIHGYVLRTQKFFYEVRIFHLYGYIMNIRQVTPESVRMAALMGGSARVCPTNVAGLSLLAAPLILFAARRFAPLRPGLAGAATGLLAGGLAATVYGLHCPEHTIAFVAVWYTLGMAIPTAIGAAIGRFVWRW